MGRRPLVAHNNHFKHQQAERLEALRAGQVPPSYGEIDHSSAEVYQAYSTQPPAEVLADCRRVSGELIDRTWALPEQDLLDPARHPWLNGRLLWLQIIVRGFWHPTGHVGDYYLACALAQVSQPDEAVRVLTEAIWANPELRANASRDRDLTALRDSGRLDVLLAPARQRPLPASRKSGFTTGRARRRRLRSSLAWSGSRRRKEFCVSCHQLFLRPRTRHADRQLR